MTKSLVEAQRAYAEFEEKVKRTVFLDNLSPQVTVAVIKQAVGQFGTVINVEFTPNYTVPYPIPLSALVEMESEKQARSLVYEMTSFPFMMAGMPRPVKAKLARIEMFADRPAPPDRKIHVHWVEQSDEGFEAVKKRKILYEKHKAQHVSMIKHHLNAEQKLMKQQEDMLKVCNRKYELLEGIAQDGSTSRMAHHYGARLDEDH